MKRLLLFLLFISSFCIAQPGDSERILRYETDMTLDTTSTLRVTEKITVRALRQEIQRGIYRTLPATRNINGKNISVRYKVKSVLKNGREEKFHIQKQEGHVYIYIGEEDVYLESGVYEYSITYETERQVGFFEGFDEIYWNVTGTDWVFPTDSIIATLHLPPNAKILRQACYTGAMGSTEQNCSVQHLSPGTIRWEAAGLGAYQGLTVAAGFTKGVVREPVLPSFLQTGKLSGILGFAGIILLGLMVFLWYKKGKDHDSPTVIPLFEVPENLSPAALGYIYNGRYKSNFIAATLIHLAVKGYLKIHEKPAKSRFAKPTFTLEKQDKQDNTLSGEEKILYDGLFQPGDQELTIENKYNSHIAGAVNDYSKDLFSRYSHHFRKGSNWTWVMLLFGLMSAVYLITLFKAHQYLFEEPALDAGLFFQGISLVCILVACASRSSFARYVWIVPLLVTAVITYFRLKSGVPLSAYGVCYFFLGAGTALLALFAYLIKQPAPEYLRLRSLIKGFKMYLETAENQLIRFHNPPAMTPEIFEKYLPYALVLGAGKIWGEKLENMLQDNAISYSNSHWHSGSSALHSSFSSSLLSRSLSQTMSTASTTPGSSGSGGGGSSGGGGGGGGGGGW